MFPTGNLVDEIDVPNIGRLKATLINAGIPTVFLNAADLGYTGKELQDDINNDAAALEKFETIRAYGALKMGLISDVSEAAARARTPKPAFVAPAETRLRRARRRLHRLQRQNRKRRRHRFAGTRPEHGQTAPRYDGHRLGRHRRRRARYAGQPCRRRRNA